MIRARNRVFVLLFALVCISTAQADPPRGLKNTGNEEWVSRRHKEDGNKHGDIAAVVSVRQGSGFDNVVASIWLYDDVTEPDENGKRYYVLREKYTGLTGNIVHKPGVRRNRETCELKLAAADGITVWVSLYRNKLNGAGVGPRIHQRVVLRYKEGDTTMVKKPTKKASDGCFQAQVQEVSSEDDCDEEPNEDVLEEEDLTPDGNGDPQVLYDES